MNKILGGEGFIELIKKLIDFLKYNLIDKYEFKYFSIKLSDFSYRFSEKSSSLNIRIANKNDIKKIKNDIYPLLGKREEYDKRFISRIGDDNIIIFLMEKNNKIIHYSLIFKNALDSPLMKTNLNKLYITNVSAYLGSVFTVPKERGVFILPSVLGYIIKYLSMKSEIEKLLILIHPPTATTKNSHQFYKILGFKEIDNFK